MPTAFSWTEEMWAGLLMPGLGSEAKTTGREEEEGGRHCGVGGS